MAHQGLALRGTYKSSDDHSNVIRGELDSNYMQLLFLRKIGGARLFIHGAKITGSIYLRMSFYKSCTFSALRKVAGRFAGQYLTTMADKTTDISNTEQLGLCLVYWSSYYG